MRSDPADVESTQPAPIKRATQAKSRKSKVVSAVAVAEPSSSSSESEEEPALPKKRKAAAIIAPSSAEKDRRQSLKYESGGESGFSDFNPFQSGAEDTPERKLKRRKVSPRTLSDGIARAAADPPSPSRSPRWAPTVAPPSAVPKRPPHLSPAPPTSAAPANPFPPTLAPAPGPTPTMRATSPPPPLSLPTSLGRRDDKRLEVHLVRLRGWGASIWCRWIR